MTNTKRAPLLDALRDLVNASHRLASLPLPDGSPEPAATDQEVALRASLAMVMVGAAMMANVASHAGGDTTMVQEEVLAAIREAMAEDSSYRATLTEVADRELAQDARGILIVVNPAPVLIERKPGGEPS